MKSESRQTLPEEPDRQSIASERTTSKDDDKQAFLQEGQTPETGNSVSRKTVETKDKKPITDDQNHPSLVQPENSLPELYDRISLASRLSNADFSSHYTAGTASDPERDSTTDIPYEPLKETASDPERDSTTDIPYEPLKEESTSTPWQRFRNALGHSFRMARNGCCFVFGGSAKKN